MHLFHNHLVNLKGICMKLAYCDYIAHVMKQGLSMLDNKKLISAVGVINFDTNADGSFMSTKKTFKVKDMQGKTYIVTVEEEHA